MEPPHIEDAVNDLTVLSFCNSIVGIVDPYKVVRIALESAASVAGTLITTECVLPFDENPSKANEPR